MEEIQTQKRCAKCGETKSVSEFHKNKCKVDGLCGYCKTCHNKQVAERVAKNPDKRKEICKKSRDGRKDKIAEYNKEYREKNLDRVKVWQKEWCDAHKEHLKQYRRENYKRNQERISKRHKAYNQMNRVRNNERMRTRRKTDFMYNLRCRLHAVIKSAFVRRNVIKTTKAVELLGCSLDFLATYLLQNMSTNLTLKENGLPEDYQIDHIIPCSWANTAEELVKLQHYTNLRLVPATENMSRGDKECPEALELIKIILGREHSAN